jgi:hypothetical protein
MTNLPSSDEIIRFDGTYIYVIYPLLILSIVYTQFSGRHKNDLDFWIKIYKGFIISILSWRYKKCNYKKMRKPWKSVENSHISSPYYFCVEIARCDKR